MKKTAFTEQLVRSLRAEALKGRKRKPVPKRIGKWRWKYPLALELKYRKALTGFFEDMYRGFMDKARVELSSVYRADAADPIDALMDDLLLRQKEWADAGARGNFLGGLFSLGEEVNAFNQQQWADFSKIAIGQAFIPDEPWVKDTLTAWADTQKTLIKSVTGTSQDRLLKIMRDGVQKGLIYSEVMAKLQAEIDGLGRKKARLLARDQIGKLNGALAQARQEQAGIEAYTWETVGDERVRGNPSGIYPRAIPSHWAIDGKVCRWDDPSVYRDSDGNWVPRTALMPRAHPGEEIQCRCVGIPVMDEIFAEAVADAGMTAAPAKGEIPTPEQALATVASWAKNPKGEIPTSLWTKQAAGPDVFTNSPYPVNDAFFDKWGKDQLLYLDHLAVTEESVHPVVLRTMFLKGKVPEEALKVVKYNKQYYLWGKKSHQRLGALRALGEYRGNAKVVDLDALIKADLKAKGIKLPKPAPVAAPVTPPAVSTPSPTITPSPVISGPMEVEIMAGDNAAIAQAMKEGKTVKIIHAPSAAPVATAPKPVPAPVVVPPPPPPPVVPAKLPAEEALEQLKLKNPGSDIDFKALGMPHQPIGWDAPLVDLPVPVSSLPKLPPAHIPMDKVVMVTGGPQKDWVEKALKHGWDPAQPPQAVLINGKYYVTKGASVVTAEYLKGAKSILLSVTPTEEAFKNAADLVAKKKAAQSIIDARLARIKAMPRVLDDMDQYIAGLKAKEAALRKKGSAVPKRKSPSPERIGESGFLAEVRENYQKHLDDLIDQGILNAHAARAMATYQGSAYKPWNRVLRGKDRYPDQAHIRDTHDLDAYLNETGLASDLRLYRGLSLEWKLDPDTAKGKVLFDGGFISASTKLETSEWFAGSYAHVQGNHHYVLVINAKKGDKFAPLVNGLGSDGRSPQYNVGEAEFLGARGQAFRIVKVHPPGEGWIEGGRTRGTNYKDVSFVEVEML